MEGNRSVGRKENAGIVAGREGLGYPPGKGTSFGIGQIPVGPSPPSASDSGKRCLIAGGLGKLWSFEEKTGPRVRGEVASEVERGKPSLLSREDDGPQGLDRPLDEKRGV